MKVVLIGGTHGNEKTGAFLIHRWRQYPERLPSAHEYLIIEGNPKALAENRRYVDVDLNRSANGGNQLNSTYEFTRIDQLASQLKEWSQDQALFVIDLHTTTSNMGCTIVLSHNDWLSANVANLTHKEVPGSKILFNSNVGSQSPFVVNLAPHGLLIEVGPVAQNTYNSHVVDLTERTVIKALNILNEIENDDSRADVVVQGFLEYGVIEYPKASEGHQTAIIHPLLQGRDYEPLKVGDPMFELLDGSSIPYQGPETTFPVFINEAAYYEKNIAMLTATPATKIFKHST